MDVEASTVTQEVLLWIKKGEGIQKKIAERMNKNPPQVSRAISILMKQGLIECINPKAKKFRYYVVTPKGDDFIKTRISRLYKLECSSSEQEPAAHPILTRQEEKEAEILFQESNIAEGLIVEIPGLTAMPVKINKRYGKVNEIEPYFKQEILKDVKKKIKQKLTDSKILKLITEQEIGRRIIAERLLTINTLVKALGQQKAKEYVIVMAKELARFTTGQIEDKTPEGFARYHELLNAVIFGSKAEILLEDGAVVLDTRSCNNLTLALEYSNGGIITKELYCDICKLYFEEMAGITGVKLDMEFAEKGCRIRVG